MTASKALIIGGGIGGPVAAMALQRGGIDATIYEAWDHPADYTGWFLNTASNGLDVLHTLGIDLASRADGHPIPRMVMWSGTGKRLGEVANGIRLEDGTVSICIKRGELQRVLREETVGRGIRIEYGKRLTGYEPTGDGGVAAVFEDGTSAEGGLLVGADGIHSATRQLLVPGSPEPAYTGLIGVGGYSHSTTIPPTPNTQHFVFGRRAFFGYLVRESGEIWWFANLARPDKPSSQELAAISGQQWKAHLLELFAGDLPLISEIIQPTGGDIGAHVVEDLAATPVWHRGPVALIGDAAHATSPNAGQGASLAMLAFAATLITAGRLGDLLGRKRLFLTGVAGFALASLACALAPNAGLLIAARAVQGAAAAVMVPQVLATYRAIFTGKERGAVFGIYGAAGGLATALGLLLGGVLVSANIFGWHWRSVFAVNIPIAAAVLIAAAVIVPETRQARAQRPDYLGLGLLCAALVAIVYPLLEGQALGWPAWTFVLIAAGVALVAALAIAGPRLTPRGAAPILPPGLLTRPAFTAGIAVQLLFFLGLQGLFVVLALWLQAGFGYSPIKAGATAATFSLGAAITAGLSVPLATRLGRYILITGALLMAAGTYGLLLAAQHASHGVSPWRLAPGLIVAGAGLGLLVVPLANLVLAAVPPSLAGGASGVFTTAQQLGGAAGVALAGTIFFPRIATEGFTSAFQATMPLAIGAFIGCALLSLALPRTAVAEAYQ